MRRTIVIPMVLVAAGLGIVALVSVQGQDADHDRSPATRSVGGQGSLSNRPARLGEMQSGSPRLLDRYQAAKRAMTPSGGGTVSDRYSSDGAPIVTIDQVSGEDDGGALPTILRPAPSPAAARVITAEADDSTGRDPVYSSRRPQAERRSPDANQPQPALPKVEEKAEPEAKPATEPAAKRAAPPQAEPKPAAKSRPRITFPAAQPAATPQPVAIEPTIEADTLLIGGQSPMLKVETLGPQTIILGRRANFVFKVSNVGTATAHDAVINIRLPRAAKVVGKQATDGLARHTLEREGASRISWAIKKIEAGTEQQLTVTVIPGAGGPLDIQVGWSVAPTTAETQVRVLEPMLELFLSGPKELLYGQTKVYTVALTNPGTGDAENVIVKLQPSGAVQQIGTIEAGGRKVIEVEITANRVGAVELGAQATAEGGLKAAARETIQVRRAKLEVALEGDAKRFAGTVASYKVRVVNTGDAAAENVVAAAVLPSGAKFVSATGEGEFIADSSVVQWTIGSLQAGAMSSFELHCTLTTAGNNKVELHTRADGDLSAATTATTQVEALADLKLRVDDPRGPIKVGEDAVYTVRITNRGTKAAEGVTVVSFFSDGIEPVVAEGGQHRISSGEVAFEPIGTIDAGQEVLLKVTAKAETPGNKIFRTEVTCRDPVTRLATEETTRFYGTPIRQPSSRASRPGYPQR